MQTSVNGSHILVGGSKGVGKTSLLKSVHVDSGFKTIIFSDELKSHSRKIYKKSFIKLTAPERDKLREIVADKILKEVDPGKYIWEVHFSCFEFGNNRIVVPKNLLSISSQFVLVKLEDGLIKLRRTNDLKNKKRSLIPRIIKRDSRIELEAAEKISHEYKTPLAFYQNVLSQSEAVNDFNIFLNKISP